MEGVARWLYPLGVVLVLVGTWAVVLTHPGAARFDQTQLVGVPLDLAHYPAFDDEVVSRLVGSLVYLVGPRSAVEANAALRLVAGTLYVGAAALLAGRALAGVPARLGFLALLFISGFPYLWLSSELIAGALVCLVVWLILTERPAWLIGACLAALALTKSELAVGAAAIGALYAWRHRRALPDLGIGLLVAGAVLCAPGILVHGRAFFETRSWFAFTQSYALVVAPMQIAAHPDPLRHWQVYVHRAFPGDTSVLQAAIREPDQYIRFVGLSLAAGARNAWNAFGLLLVAIAVRIGLRGTGMRPFEAWLLAVATTLIPEVLVSFPHVRYMAKLAPLLLLVPLAEAESRPGPWRIVLIALLTVGAALLLVNRIQTPGPQFWFPD